MDRQPDRLLIRACPFHAVALMGWDVDEIAGFERDVARVAIEAKPGGPLKQKHPFGPLLIKPDPRGGGVAFGDDPFNAEAGGIQQGCEYFIQQAAG